MKRAISIAIPLIIVLFLLIAGKRLFITVPPGHVAVATLFGKVVPTPYKEGLHIPVNPLYNWTFYDTRKKTLKEVVSVPSQDQLQTSVEVSIQYEIIPSKTPQLLQNTGTAEDAVKIHLVPKFRSAVREQGKSIKRAEDFYQKETQDKLQENILTELQTFLAPKGINVEDILIRDITLPEFITKAIEDKKVREQEGQKQIAELERYTTEQKQQVVAAEAQREAAEKKAEMIKMLADAEAYKIAKINNAIKNNPSYIKLQAMEALKAISKDKSSKIYFINGDSPSPLPLMNIGDK